MCQGQGTHREQPVSAWVDGTTLMFLKRERGGKGSRRIETNEREREKES